MSDTKSKGIVKWFNPNKGFGFITCEEYPEKDIFVHFSQIQDESSNKFKTLKEGSEVEFFVVEGDKGLTAQEVTKL